MGDIIRRGQKLYIRYKDLDGVRRMRLARGAANVGEAKRMLLEAERNVMNGRIGIEEPTEEDAARRTLTLAELVEKFNAEYRPIKVKDIEEYRSQTKSGMAARVLPVLGTRPAASITTDDVEALRDALLDQEYAGGSVSWTLSRLSKVYAWGLKKGVIAGSNPASGVEHPDVNRSFDYLSAAEVGALLRYLEGHQALTVERRTPQVFPMVATAIYAGLRKGELWGLRWIDLHFDRAQITIARSYDKAPKSGKPRHVPMHSELGRILRQWRDKPDRPQTDDGLVFPMLDVCDGWRMGDRQEMLLLAQWLKLAGCHVPLKPWHALRHTFASHFMMAGGNILTLQKLLGHASIEMTMIYAHLAPDFMAAEVARMAFPTTPAEVVNLDEQRRKKAAQDTGGIQETTPTEQPSDNTAEVVG